MFKHILVPTDGSKLAAKGVKAGIRLARSLGATVTAVHVIPPNVPSFGAGLAYVPAITSREHRKACAATAKAVLAGVAREARRARVPCATLSITDPQPWGGILRVAHTKKCDAIAIASHGRGALGGLLLGSQAQRVLAHSKVPVLVTR